MIADTPGKRLYLIRLACGDGVRTAEPLKAFAARLKRETRETYHPNALSLLERDEQGWRVSDVEILCRVDPLERGRVWLAFGEDVEAGQASDAPPDTLDGMRRAEGSVLPRGTDPLDVIVERTRKKKPTKRKRAGGTR